jgi:hypothetical protein
LTSALVLNTFLNDAMEELNRSGVHVGPRVRSMHNCVDEKFGENEREASVSWE